MFLFLVLCQMSSFGSGTGGRGRSFAEVAMERMRGDGCVELLPQWSQLPRPWWH